MLTCENFSLDLLLDKYRHVEEYMSKDFVFAPASQVAACFVHMNEGGDTSEETNLGRDLFLIPFLG